MPVIPNLVGVIETPTALLPVSLTLQPFDKEARMILGSTGSVLVGTLQVSIDNANWVGLASIRETDGQPMPSTGPWSTGASYWFKVGGWDYVQFLPSSLVSGPMTIQLLSAPSLGGSPVSPADYDQETQMILGLSAMTDINLFGATSP